MAAPNFPNSFIRTSPILLEPFQDSLHVLPTMMRRAMAIFVCQIHRVHKLTIDVQLELLIRCVADTHGTRILVAGKVVQRNLIKLQPAVKSVHHLEWATLSVVAQSILQPFDECFCLLNET